MSDRYSLAEARAIIDAETCMRDWNGPWCDVHDAHWPDSEEECKARPEVADVAAQLLATVERVRARVGAVTDNDCSCGGCGSCTYHGLWKPLLLAAINGEEVTE